MMMENFSDYGIEIPYRRASGNIKTTCPHCRATRQHPGDRSLSVNLDEGVWMCHHCGWSGALKGYERKRFKTRKTYVRPPQPTSYEAPQDKALAWFKGRCISPATLETAHVTSGMEYMPQSGETELTAQFNYILDGELVNVKYRAIADKRFKMAAGAELIPYNIDSLKEDTEGNPDYAIITEGEMDCLSFIEIGCTAVVSVPAGANGNLSWLDDFAEGWFDSKHTIYVASDSDAKGVQLRDELVRRFGAERCRIIDYGTDCKDANEVLMRHGGDVLAEKVKTAREARIEGLLSVSDYEDDLDELYRNGLQRGKTLGLDNLDRYLSVEPKRLMTVTGIPGMGKSEFVDEMCIRLNVRYGWKTAYFSPENSPVELHASKLIAKLTGRHFGAQTLDAATYDRAKEYMQDNFVHILPRGGFLLETILEKARAAVVRKGVRVVVIDPYNRLEAQQSASMSETLYISKVLDTLTNFAQERDVLVILVAHPRKMQRGDDGRYQIPDLYDISGSANFFNKSDFGITVHRFREEGYTVVKVTKVKFAHLGSLGTAQFKYNTVNGRYMPWENGGEITWDNRDYIELINNGGQLDAMDDSLSKSEEPLPF
jgi:twinkle protein